MKLKEEQAAKARRMGVERENTNEFLKRYKQEAKKSKEAEANIYIPGESNISKTLTERTTKTVIILILSTLFILPLFEREMYFQPQTSFEYGF